MARYFHCGMIPHAIICNKIGLSTVERNVLMDLLYYRNGAAGLCCPSQGRIAQDLDISVRTVNRTLRRLMRRRLITWSRRPYHNTYEFYGCADPTGARSVIECDPSC